MSRTRKEKFTQIAVVTQVSVPRSSPRLDEHICWFELQTSSSITYSKAIMSIQAKRSNELRLVLAVQTCKLAASALVENSALPWTAVLWSA